MALINGIRTARMVYYVGGGYLMGPTASRLWDGMLVCKIAALFGTPVVMSGQNIGLWQGDYDRQCASEGFPSVALIGTRDRNLSRMALAEVGVFGDKIFATHDDAFFIPSVDSKVTTYILWRVGLAKKRPFIALNLHIEDGAIEIVSSIRRLSDLPVLMIPTCPPDLKCQRNIIKKLHEHGVKNVFNVKKVHSHLEIKGLISHSHVCISSRHHPLIFALGRGVPCLSINFSDYFNFKNKGAMELCGVTKFSLDFKDKDFSDIRVKGLDDMLRVLFQERALISKDILCSHPILIQEKQRFLSEVKRIWDNSGYPKQIRPSD